MARVRSPNYPQLSLPAAVERIAHIFAKEHQHPAPREVVAQHLGYGGINGASLGAISALLKYGLLEKVNEDLKVSDSALAILHPSSEEEKYQTLKAAAEAPVLFTELLSHFNGRLPSDENLRSYLVRRGFAPNSLNGVIEILRETMEYVGGVPPNSSASTQKVTATVEPNTGVMTFARSIASAPEVATPVAVRVGSVSVSLQDDQLRVSAILIDQKGVDKLIQALQANKVLLPTIADTAGSGSASGPLSSGGSQTPEG